MNITAIEVNQYHQIVYVDSVDVRTGREVSITIPNADFAKCAGTFIVTDVGDDYIKVVNRNSFKIEQKKFKGKTEDVKVPINFEKTAMSGSIAVL